VNVPTTAPHRSRAYALCQVIGWGVYAASGLAITAGFSQLSPRLALTMVMGCAIAAGGTHLLRGQIRRRNWWDLKITTLAPRLLGGALLVAFAVELAILLLGTYVTRVYTWTTSTPGILVATTFNWCFTIVLWTSFYAGVQFFRRYRLAEIRRLQMEVAARVAQLSALNAQINPHFLFNALNTLRALIPEDPARARDLVTELAELMRYALQAGSRERVPLAEELAVVEAYLRLESARFEDRLRWTMDASDGAGAALIPPMVLQSLVENAVKHGIATRPEGGSVALTACREGASLRLRVRNPGRLAPPREGAIGLANVEQRLKLRYGEGAGLSLSQQADDVVAEITLPLEFQA
jgi:histidine kinase